MQEMLKPLVALLWSLVVAGMSAKRTVPSLDAFVLHLLSFNLVSAFNPAASMPCAVLKDSDVLKSLALIHLCPWLLHTVDCHSKYYPQMAAQKLFAKKHSCYRYRNLDGELMYTRARSDFGNKTKAFKTFTYNGAPKVMRTLYHLEELRDKPFAPILLVEGEKTADAAVDKMHALQGKQYIAMTWPRGAHSVSIPDWSCLAGREILIWPDNDPPGFLAARKLERILLEEGAKQVKTIDRKWLKERFPSKWDLADPWPEELSEAELLEKSNGVQVHAPALYNVKALMCNPNAPVVVVVGQSVADAASHKMQELQGKEYIGVTWPGGPAGASKIDWSLLTGREVLIWPSNDAAGFATIKPLASILFPVGPREIKTIDGKWLRAKFPKKWNLADPWPKQLSKAELVERSIGKKIRGHSSKNCKKKART